MTVNFFYKLFATFKNIKKFKPSFKIYVNIAQSASTCELINCLINFRVLINPLLSASLLSLALPITLHFSQRTNASSSCLEIFFCLSFPFLFSLHSQSLFIFFIFNFEFSAKSCSNFFFYSIYLSIYVHIKTTQSLKHRMCVERQFIFIIITTAAYSREHSQRMRFYSSSQLSNDMMTII